ncbi:MAG: hypothetical protein KGQ37_06215 [Hyphomicrobiales bacterium]|nr:hypothetical protein [Hyphomicrobiales bacterium]
MIEQLMYFAIGALTMGLFGAFFLPAYRRRAVRLARHHLQLQMPMTMADVTAGLDAVRAEAATRQRALEQQAERARADLAEHQARLGHVGNQLSAAEAGMAALRTEHEATLDDLAAARSEAADLRASQGAALQALYNTDQLAADQRLALRAADTERERLEGEIQSDRMTIAALSTRIEGDTLTIGDLRHKLQESTARHDGALTIAANLRQARNELQEELQRRNDAVQQLQGRHESLLTRYQQTGASLAQARDATAALERELESWKVKFRELEASFQRASSLQSGRDTKRKADHKAMESRLAQQEQDLQALRSENATLQGRIDALTRDRHGSNRNNQAGAEAALPALSGVSAADVAALRQTIRALGIEVATLAGKGAAPLDPASEGQIRDQLAQLQNRLPRSVAAG